MKVSAFLLYAPLPNGDFLIRQTNSGSIIRLDKDSTESLRLGNLDNFDGSDIEELASQGFVITDETDEQATFLTHYSQTWEGLDTFLLHLIPTTNCQLDCIYCYEDGIDRTRLMDDNNISKVIDWIDNYLSETRLGLMRVVWHGGEPLLYHSKILSAMPMLKEVAEKHGIPLETQIVSNGVRADETILRFLADYSLTRLQITFDGPPDVHNKRRWMKGSHSGSFDAIHRNMMVALDKGLLEKIDIRVNLDRQNRGRALELFELLAKDGIQAKTHLSLGIIANTLPRDECHSGANGYFAQYGFSEDEAVEEYLEATKSALSFGFEPAEELIVGPWCVARHPHAWTIGPDLEIYKCLSMVGRPDGVIGNLPEVPDNNEVTEYTIGKIKSCLAEGCPMVPVCGGGCLFDERVSGKRNCPRSLLERVNIGLMTINHSQ